jgi:hypothetical protein
VSIDVQTTRTVPHREHNKSSVSAIIMHQMFLKFLLLALCLVGVSVVGANPTDKDIKFTTARDVSPSIVRIPYLYQTLAYLSVQVPPALVVRIPEANDINTPAQNTTAKNLTTSKSEKSNNKSLKVLIEVAIIMAIVVVVVVVCVLAFLLIRKKRQQRKRVALQNDIPQMAGPVGTMVELTGSPNQAQEQRIA